MPKVGSAQTSTAGAKRLLFTAESAEVFLDKMFFSVVSAISAVYLFCQKMAEFDFYVTKVVARPYTSAQYLFRAKRYMARSAALTLGTSFLILGGQLVESLFETLGEVSAA